MPHKPSTRNNNAISRYRSSLLFVGVAATVFLLFRKQRNFDFASFIPPSSVVLLGDDGMKAVEAAAKDEEEKRRSLEGIIQKEVQKILAAERQGSSTKIDDASSNTDTVTAPSATSSSLPSCKAMMQSKDSPFRDGSFLTRPTIPVVWIPRVDGSRQLHHSMCDLHRYTAAEARQCLVGKHVNMIGDSLTRYQYLSLAWFLHKGTYPPRFPRASADNCRHVDEHGQLQCSPLDEPNICFEGDWIGVAPQGREYWVYYKQTVGSAKLFDGHMESSAIRSSALAVEMCVENNVYVSPPISASTATTTSDNNNEYSDRLIVSYSKENGFHHPPNPINGWNLTGCAYTGSCEYPDELADRRVQLAQNMTFDFSEPLEQAVDTGGVLRRILPPVDIVLYNRGLWGGLNKESAEVLFPRFHDYAQGETGQCYFRSTTGRFETTLNLERKDIRPIVLKAGCGYIDFAHVVADFNQLEFFHPIPPSQKKRTINVMGERGLVYWDSVHFMPWVYEELNNLLLNIWCNADE